MEEKNQVAQKQFLLSFGNRLEEARIPYFPPFYSYLLLLSENVGLVEIYPWLAELMFYSAAVDKENLEDREVLNVVSFFVDDHRFNIANTMLRNEAEGNEDPFVKYKKEAKSDDKKVEDIPPRQFVVDTFAEFGVDLSEKPPTVEGVTTYSLVGAGNPMQMMRTFTQIGELTDDKNDLGKLNCFIINSISNLCRTMGLRDAMLMIRAMLERAVWKPIETDESDTSSDGDTLMDKDGMLFAILHKDVFSKEEIQYASTFFDGIVEFEGRFGHDNKDGESKIRKKFIGYRIKSFPGLRDSKNDKGGSKRWYNFDVPVWYEPLAGQRMEILEDEKIEILNHE